MSVQVGLKDLHYALLTPGTDTKSVAPVYELPVSMAATVEAITAKISPNLIKAALYANDVKSEEFNEIKDLTVELNVKDIPLSIQAVLLGHTLSAGVIVKSRTDEAPYVALGFRSMKKNGSYRYIWLYKGKFELQEQDYKTKGETPEFQTPTIKATFEVRVYDGNWQAVGDDDAAGFVAAATWFDAVYPDAAPAALEVVVSPVDDAIDVAVSSNVTWTYNNAIDSSYVNADNFYLVNAAGDLVAAALSLNPAGKVVTLDPNVNLSALTLYIAVASNAAKDIYGQQVGAKTVSNFTTAA